MYQLLWDASALAKRYTQEEGSEIVQELFVIIPLSQMVTTIWGFMETFSILLRRHNGGVIDSAVFAKAASALDNEFLSSSETFLLTIEDTVVLSGLPLMRKHNLNATDAAILQS